MGIHKVITFSCPPEKLWEIVGTPDRVDWLKVAILMAKLEALSGPALVK
jgi:hypothetical protein